MKKLRIALLAAVALAAYPTNVLAQGGKGAAKGAAKADEEEEEEEEGDEEEGKDKKKAEEGDEEEGEEEGGEEEGEEEEEEEEGEKESDLAGICQVDPAACPKVDFDKEAKRDIHEQLYAVQQIFALRVRRFEVQPYWSFTLNDQFVSHNGPGVGLNYYITNVLAVGANFNFYRPFNNDSEFNFQTRRAARVGVPLNEYDWGAGLNFTYVPAYGKFAGFGDFIFQWDAYIVGGVGAISTRPIPVMDPDNRNFDYEPKLAFNAGFGLHVFFNRWFAVTGEVRDYIYNEKLEALEVPDALEDQTNPDNWFGDDKLTNNIQAQIGVSIFIPFSFEYRLPK